MLRLFAVKVAPNKFITKYRLHKILFISPSNPFQHFPFTIHNQYWYYFAPMFKTVSTYITMFASKVIPPQGIDERNSKHAILITRTWRHAHDYNCIPVETIHNIFGYNLSYLNTSWWKRHLHFCIIFARLFYLKLLCNVHKLIDTLFL